MLRTIAVAICLAPLAGCGSDNVVPVSGSVTMNGKLLPNAYVVFQPIGTKDNPNPGRGSSGITDSDGRYTLLMDGERKGAVVGWHRVAIASVLKGELKAREQFNPETGSPDGAPPAPRRGLPDRETIPVRYNDQTELKFEVPRGGTDKADFNLKSP